MVKPKHVCCHYCGVGSALIPRRAGYGRLGTKETGTRCTFPQLPDPKGWDVAYSGCWLADDWRCSETGPVSDVHFWVSFSGWSFDYVPESMSNATVRLQIWSGQSDRRRKLQHA